jgi:deazaflavin-dependent oxidoreductase (nitroreductase family)
VTTRNNWNGAIIEEFRSHKGQVGGGFAGRPLLLLHTTGAKSGQERVNPLAYIRDDGHIIIVASKSGAPTNPDWFHNLIANPEVTVELGAEQLHAHANVAEEPERSRLYAEMIKVHPGFADYPGKTSRTIPVVILTPDN